MQLSIDNGSLFAIVIYVDSFALPPAFKTFSVIGNCTKHVCFDNSNTYHRFGLPIALAGLPPLRPSSGLTLSALTQ